MDDQDHSEGSPSPRSSSSSEPSSQADVLTAQLLLKKGKRYAARYLRDECLRAMSSQDSQGTPAKVLPELLDLLLNPAMRIKNLDTIDWLKWLMAAGRTPDDFFNTVRRYDNATTCGLVWTANFVAYRCRTCGISPCMSLCAQCFQEGDHEGHDFNMFRSQAGGACDCGNSAVMKETGFCHRHGSQAQLNKPEVPPDLLAIADAMMPRIFLRFIQHCRESSSLPPKQVQEAMEDSSLYLDLLQDLSRLGAAMRRTMTKSLCNPKVYSELTQPSSHHVNNEYLSQSKIFYEEAINSIPFGDVPPGYEDIATLNGPLIHKTFLDEIVFWTVKFEFPQKLVCLLLNMLPDTEYEDAFARAFVQHYSRISVMLVQSKDSETLSNRVVHVSVQLFSDQDLAYRMTDSFHLLHIMIVSLKNMMKNICIPSTLHDKRRNTHKVVKCEDHVMKNHCYWPLVSDLNNVLSHKPIAVKFMSDPILIQEWFSFLSMFQGMNVNVRELTHHVEFEPQTYYAAFSAELEASASPMWALVSHLKDSETKHYTFSVLRQCLHALSNWFNAVGFARSDMGDPYQVSFHLPLHRYYSVFMCQAVRAQGAQLADVLPPQDLLHLIMVHPLRLQAAFYEILSGMWVRNGLQIKGQAMTYIQCHFCNSMVDADLYLLQICAGELPPDNFIMTVLDRFHVLESLSLSPRASNSFLDSEHEVGILESCLTFLATLMTVRTNIGLSESELAQLEMVTLLCMGDKTHSQLMEYMPEKCGSAAQSRDFEAVLSRVSSYRAPNFEASGTMQQGMYIPRNHVWENLYDPIYVLLRAVQRKDFQASLDRFKLFCKQSGNISNSGNLWPPFRLPSSVRSPYTDPQRIIGCRSFHAVILVLLYNALNEITTNDHLLSLTIYLLELTVEYQAKHQAQGGEVMAAPFFEGVTEPDDDKPDGQFSKWFASDDIFTNANTVVSKVHLNPTPSISSCSDGDPSDLEDMDEIEAGAPRLALPGAPQPRPLPLGSELVVYQQNVSAVVPLGEVPTTPDTPTQDQVPPLALPPPVGTPASPVSSPVNMLVPLVDTSTADGVSSQASLPAPTQYPPLLAGTEVGRRGNGRSGSSRSRNRLNPSFALKPHFNRSRRPAGPSNALLPPGSTSPPQLQAGDQYVAIEDSIISLLIKLHSKLTGKPNSYRPNFEDMSDSRIGDGPFFIAKLLNKLGRHDLSAKKCILDTIARLYCKREEDSSASSEEEARAREEKRKRAKERQKRVMAEFANRQRQFMEQNKAEAAEAEAGVNDAMEVEEQEPERQKEYDCVICNQSIPSTPERPVGLVVLLQATSVLGHRTSSQKPLSVPTSDSERIRLKQRRYTLGQYMEERADTLNRHFDIYYYLQNSWLASMNIGWEGGVHVQTCGHHLHLDCHQSYLLALRSQHRPNNTLNVDKGEYWCPLCRQLGNSVLPISPEIGDLSALVKHPSTCDSDLVEEVDRLLNDLTVPTFSSSLTNAMAHMMEDMTVATYAKYRNVSTNPSTPSLFMFVSSILRTNLEVELVQRGGSLVYQAQDAKMDVKRSCLMPLLHVLGFHSKILNGGGDYNAGGIGGGLHWIRQTWASISQRPVTGSEGAVTPREREVPLLLRDPVTLLLQLVLLLPSRIDQGYLRCVVANVYRVAVVGAAVSALRALNESQRDQATNTGPLAPLLALAHNTLRDSPFFCDDQVTLPDQPQDSWTVNDVTCQVRETCLQFLRIAALLKAHLAEENSPVIADPIAECGALEQYLGVWDTCSVVNSTIMGNMCGTYRASEVSSPVETRLGDLAGGTRVWCSEVAAFASQAQVAASTLLTSVHFSQPRLLKLPHSYDAIFQYYHRRQCSQCNSVPKDPSVCLLCGTIVCLRETCCKQQEICECVQHAIDCGAGTAIFLVINSSTVIVIRGPRVCLWGCVHLDSFGEEDRDLKRGKPLYLSEDRYHLLEQQWLSHGFDHTNKRWIWHRDIL
ncbi:E3 ubiquitin-protein ligase ubr3-like isoform X3 [Macrobrachium nipponense]|uniref:E3 ubiquitin-protein ligase ubr3-like isoform X3 n=1 Tax=Macrobrachium nipponense TaxID=159736 RepID=UPI0030C83D2C